MLQSMPNMINLNSQVNDFGTSATFLKDYLNKSPCVCLVGAGISRNSPCSLPLGDDLKVSLFKSVCRDVLLDQSIENKFLNCLKEFRPEYAIEQMTGIFFKAMIPTLVPFVRNIPNLNHFNLIRLLKMNKISAILTTNIDVMFEKAIKSIYNDQFSNVIYNPDKDIEVSSMPQLVKLHGSIPADIETCDERSFALSIKQTYGIFFKKTRKILDYYLNRYNLIVLGYSGRDDFDLNPYFSPKSFKKDVIWIDHDDDSQVFNINDRLNNTNISNSIVKAYEGKIIYIKTDTSQILSHLLNGESRSNVEDDTPVAYREISFEGLTKAQQYLLVALIFGMHGQYREDALRCMHEGLRNNPDIKTEIIFRQLIGMQLQYTDYGNKVNDAEDFLLHALELSRKNRFKNYESLILMELGLIGKYCNDDFDTSIKYLKESKQIASEIADKKQEGLACSNLGHILYRKAFYKELDIKKKNEFYYRAIDYYREAKVLLLETNSLVDYCGLLDGLAWVYLRVNDYKMALKYWVEELGYREPMLGREESSVKALSVKIAALMFCFGRPVDIVKKYFKLFDDHKPLQNYWICILFKYIMCCGKIEQEIKMVTSTNPYLTINQLINSGLVYRGPTSHPFLKGFDLKDISVDDIINIVFQYTDYICPCFPNGISLLINQKDFFMIPYDPLIAYFAEYRFDNLFYFSTLLRIYQMLMKFDNQTVHEMLIKKKNDENPKIKNTYSFLYDILIIKNMSV